MRSLLVLAVLGSTADAKPCVEEATVNGLWICGNPTEAPSHGGEEFIRNAHYKLENRAAKPVVVELLTLDILDPKAAPTPLAIDYANFLPAPTRVTKATIAPGAKLELVIFGKGSLRGIQYHTVYRHRVRFRVDGVETSVKASDMYFRYPRKRL
jgi:hypothetical protein